MVSGRPLLYLSLPGVAFILGVFWFRRRYKNCLDKLDDEDSSTINDSSIEPTVQARKANGVLQNGKLPQQPASKSMNIDGTLVNGSGSGCSSDEKDSPTTMLYGKSAPIKIQSNGRSSNGKHQQQIDSEILKSKIQDAEHKTLCSIDEDFENLSSPRDLPDSVNTRISFYNRKTSQKTVEPVVIKATRTPKISPENSFLDTNYTNKECEQNNNCEPKEEPAKEEPAKEEPAKEEPSKKEADQEELEQDQEQTVLKEEVVDNNGNQKRNVDAASPSLSICSFLFPISLIGHLYGRKRAFINQIKAKTLASVSLGKNPYSGKVRICTIEGTESEIDAALAMIRQRLPAKRYPNFTMQRIHFALPQTIVPLSTESLYNLQLKLIEGINNDVVVSAVLSGSHIFIQHPLHPSHPSLPLLQKQLYDSYSTMEAPLLPSLELSAVCVIPINDVWYRVQIVDTDPEDEERCVIKFLDFGGYMNVGFNTLRQIRTDFMNVPFQSTECILSNIEPIDGTWSIEAAEILNQLTKGIVLQAQVAGYNSHNIPEIFLFASLGPNNVIFINKELVGRKLANWVEMSD
ncbi:GM12645 [Drosophila sechellia]|uniref:GM12645 n=1 Tax=Drosophila sechellia TaxID=7238 RepID=B4I0P5_DROSE|nr:GM12645 [Drosophila sechellia]